MPYFTRCFGLNEHNKLKHSAHPKWRSTDCQRGKRVVSFPGDLVSSLDNILRYTHGNQLIFRHNPTNFNLQEPLSIAHYNWLWSIKKVVWYEPAEIRNDGAVIKPVSFTPVLKTKSPESDWRVMDPITYLLEGGLSRDGQNWVGRKRGGTNKRISPQTVLRGGGGLFEGGPLYPVMELLVG